MAKPGTWVGLDTDAAAGRNGPITDERGPDDIETVVTHDSGRHCSKESPRSKFWPLLLRSEDKNANSPGRVA